jgi:hypothetical protein
MATHCLYSNVRRECSSDSFRDDVLPTDYIEVAPSFL